VVVVARRTSSSAAWGGCFVGDEIGECGSEIVEVLLGGHGVGDAGLVLGTWELQLLVGTEPGVEVCEVACVEGGDAGWPGMHGREAVDEGVAEGCVVEVRAD
jgi:hypothetical protein